MFQQVAKFVFHPSMHRVEREIIAGVARGAAAIFTAGVVVDLGKQAFKWTKGKIKSRQSAAYQGVHTATQEAQPTA